MKPKNHFSCDVGIVGGGLTGLILAKFCTDAGYKTIVVQQGRWGGGQSEFCQGILHSGLKYLDKLSSDRLVSRLIRAQREWCQILDATNGSLSGAAIGLTNVHYLFSKSCDARQFSFHTKAHECGISIEHFTDGGAANFYSLAGFEGEVFSSSEMAVDISLLVRGLLSQLQNPIQSDWAARIFRPERTVQEYLISAQNVSVECRYVAIAAGANTAMLAQSAGMQKPELKRRPLSIAIIRGFAFRLTAHVYVARPRPFMTISSIRECDGSWTWLIGGDIGEGLQDPHEFEKRVWHAIKTIFPNFRLDQRNLQTASLFRIEPFDGSVDVADDGLIAYGEDTVACVPTKMSLLPILCTEILQNIGERIHGEE